MLRGCIPPPERIAGLQGHGLSLHVSEVVQRLAECGKARLVGGGEFRGEHDAEARHLPRLLRVCGKRRCEDTEGKGDH